MKKTCINCGNEYDISEFRKQRETRDGHVNQCRLCLNEIQREKRKRMHNSITQRYEKTKDGFLMRLYRNMQSRVYGIQKEKSYLYEGCSILTRYEFYHWADNSSAFHSLFDDWVKSGYEQKLTPSVDRVNSNEGYFIGNMEWVTHSENSRRGAISPKRLIKKGGQRVAY